MRMTLLLAALTVATGLLSATLGRSKARARVPRMCGLVVVIDPNLSPDELEAYTRKLTDKLVHRGPDQQDFFGSGGVGLGHTRLSIMDPNGGKQPLVSESGATAMVHNGEIYNFKALRERVQKEHADAGRAPYAFSTNSDSEVCLPLFEDHGTGVASALDGMFAIVVASTDGSRVLAARDPCGIKPLYRGWDDEGERTLFASELKCLVGQCDHVEEFPCGHLWTSDGGYERYFEPPWLSRLIEPDSPAAQSTPLPTGSTERLRGILKEAVRKRMMSDVGYGLLLSGGLDSAIVATLISEIVDMRTIKSFTVGMANSPDVMAARAVASVLGCEHYEYLFTAEEAFDIIPLVVYHLETYEPELIRSSIPNYFLAKLAGSHTKVVLTGEGADELFAGYLYFKDSPSREMLHDETLRIWDHLHNVNLQRSDRMSMAHGLEARVPFLDVQMLQEAYGAIDPAVKMHAHDQGRIEKWALRALFEGSPIPEDVLWRTKAMQCEGVGVDWVSVLQSKCEEAVSDEAFAAAATRFPTNPPQSKEEYYYRQLFEESFPNMDKFVHVWEGGCRAGGAPWDNTQYTRAGLKDTSQLTHGLQEGVDSKVESIKERAASPIMSAPRTSAKRTPPPKMALVDAEEDTRQHPPSSNAAQPLQPQQPQPQPHASLAHVLTSGADTRVLIDGESGRNSYHCPPLPLDGSVVRGSCTGSPPTARGTAAAAAQLERLDELKASGEDSYVPAFGEEVDAVRRRLGEALALPKGSALVLCASGTCAEYIPLAIARELFPTAPIHSVLAADGETGSGGPAACSGEYFNPMVPCSPTEPREVGAPLGFGEVRLTRLPARNAAGVPTDAASTLADSLAAGADGGDGEQPPVWVVRQVLGSKTGLSTGSLEEALPASSSEERLLEVVDLCQARLPLDTVGSLVAAGKTVLLTGSKFYQGATFSAAVAVPPALVSRLTAGAPTAPPLPSGLSDFLTAHEVPRELAHWRAQLPRSPNEGLLLRWHTALPLVEAVSALSPSRRSELEHMWSQQVSALVGDTKRLEVFSSELGIVSISCELPHGQRANKAELKRVHRWLSADLSRAPNAAACAAAATPVFVGQPVEITSEHAVLRLALGAELLLDLDAEVAHTTVADEVAVAKLGWLVQNYEALLAWSSPEPVNVAAPAVVPPAAAPAQVTLKPPLTPPISAEAAGAHVSVSPVMQLVAEPVGELRIDSRLNVDAHILLPNRRHVERGTDVAHAKSTLFDADAVCFDVDGTVINEEAINLLAEQLGVGEQVRTLTLAAQEGALPFDEALNLRLQIMRPSTADVEMLLKRSNPHHLLTPGVLKLMRLLREMGKAVYLVSGGFTQLITPIAHTVGVPLENVYANTLLFHPNGSFRGRSMSQLMAKEGGKSKVLATLKAANGYKKIVMVGDGATDMEARDLDGSADAFIGFGGVKVRSVVEANACWFVSHFDEMTSELEAHVRKRAVLEHELAA